MSKINDTLVKSKLIGSYNFNNIAAAITIGKYFNIDTINIKNAIEAFVPKNNRSQIIEKATNKIILDAYNANPTSMEAALNNFEKLDNNKIVFLGDMFELGKESLEEHQTIVNLINQLEINEAVFIGEHFFECEITSKKTKKYKTFNSFKDDYNFSKIQHTNILIKGSRGMALERVLDKL